MLLIALTIALYNLHYWFVIFPMQIRYVKDFQEAILPIALSVQFYIELFVPIAVWHFGDFMRNTSINGQILRTVFSHRFFRWLLIIHGALIIFVASDFLNDLFCPEVKLPEGYLYFDGCGSWTPEWKLAIWVASWLAICLTALSKFGASVIAFFKRDT